MQIIKIISKEKIKKIHKYIRRKQNLTYIIGRCILKFCDSVVILKID